MFGRYELWNFWEGFVEAGHGFDGLDTGALRGGPAMAYDGYDYASLSIATPSTQRLTARLQVRGSHWHEGEGGSLSLGTMLGLRPSPGFELSLAPGVSWNRDPSQYVATLPDNGEDRYVLGRLRQVTTSLTARLNYTFSPTLSFELYAQPFISAGHYTTFYGVADRRAPHFDDRFRALDVGYDAADDRYSFHAGPEGAGPGGATLEFANPDFSVREMNTNAVLRWEYRPGSTLFLVWSQGRSGFDTNGRFDLVNGARGLLDAAGTNVLLVKLSYWLDG